MGIDTERGKKRRFKTTNSNETSPETVLRKETLYTLCTLSFTAKILDFLVTSEQTLKLFQKRFRGWTKNARFHLQIVRSAQFRKLFLSAANQRNYIMSSEKSWNGIPHVSSHCRNDACDEIQANGMKNFCNVQILGFNIPIEPLTKPAAGSARMNLGFFNWRIRCSKGLKHSHTEYGVIGIRRMRFKWWVRLKVIHT